MLGQFDVLVLPSLNEGQPVVVLEAMTAGVPTWGTEVGGMAQLITDPLTTPGGRTFGPAGVLLAPDDRLPVTMADALEGLLRDPSDYVQMSRDARGRVENFFQLEDAMGAYNGCTRRLRACRWPAWRRAQWPNRIRRRRQRRPGARTIKGT